MDLPQNFYKDVERKGYLQYVLYSDTDSIFITIPTKNNQISVDEMWIIAEDTADKINKLIIDYTTQILLPRQNINPKYNETFFKTEFVIDSIMFIDVKKNYAYKLLLKEGKKLDVPKVQYTNISVKSDIPTMTKRLLRDLIENIMLNSDIPTVDKVKHISNTVITYNNDFINKINEYDLIDIAVPGKWAKRDNVINAMELYNFITQTKTFTPGSAGKTVYCNFKNPQLLSGIDLSKTKSIAIPYEYNIKTFKDAMEKFQIIIDHKTQWDKVFATVCDRVVELAKKISIS